MVNSDAGYEVLQAAGYSLVHNVLGFEPPTSQNWASSLSPMYHSMPVHEDSTQSYPEPELPLEAYEGTYSDPGYGAFTLCSPMSTSNYCWGVLTTFATVLTHNDTPGLYAAWPRVWTSHLQIIPVEGNKFDLQAFTIFPEGYGKDKAPFVARIDGGYRYSGEFIVKGGKVQGLAFPDGLDAESLPNADRDRPLEETAIVYFERV
ncbi:hypothetical protein PHLCEN_2v12047 [Hermanssonia centrifuga]|uniref:Uncharacterized protein n=1 Tax=Hermanssonia centrifuga TaxID=98765 RepID=A0A2R6NI54_9APHY|nr:hypothetical protein PHLCEN_2v12047 [Hermanssonia centrifuga]